MSEPLVYEALPTPLAQAARRVNAVPDPSSGDFFLMTSYMAEAAVKLIAVALHAALKEGNRDLAYRMAHNLVRADGLGDWEQAVWEATTSPASGFFHPDLYPVLEWLTKRRHGVDEKWFEVVNEGVTVICADLGCPNPIPDRKPKVMHLISSLVQIRNKTKAHGAVGPSFFEAANTAYLEAVRGFIDSCPLFQWNWTYLFRRGETKHGIALTGLGAKGINTREVENVPFDAPGVHYWPAGATRPYDCAHLLFADQECREFWVPNGSYNDAGPRAEFIDYGTGRTRTIEVPHLARPPVPLPKSITHGGENLDVQSNVFGNLPRIPAGYVRRRALEELLETRIRDGNHHIVTLHGRGGIGKTSLALRVCHTLAADAEPPFEAIIWFSARDLELKATGPSPVRPAVVDLADVAETYGGLFDTGREIEDFGRELETAEGSMGVGRLFVFDNFETMRDTRALHEFLDTHTHLPNKALITSRERSFKADFPIEVRGMEYSEAEELLVGLSAELNIEKLMTKAVIERLFDYSEGHPYVLRVLTGEMAKEGRYVSPKTLVPRRADIVNAVFERSFNRLSESGRRVFLTISNWRSAISELALLVVLGVRNLNVEEGIDECVRLSLVSRMFFADDQPAYAAPQLARVFGQKKLEGDPDRLVIQEDLGVIRRFGVVPVGQPIQIPEEDALRDFIRWCLEDDDRDGVQPSELNKDTLLASLAELWPAAWLSLADRRQRRRAPQAEVEYALRRAVEEGPREAEAWKRRAAYARAVGDEATWISSRIRLVELFPDDLELILDVANDLNNYISQHADEIPTTRRGVYLASVRDKMERHANQLDATGLSRLAWLFLHEGNQEDALKYASQGLTMDGSNEHCAKLVERLYR